MTTDWMPYSSEMSKPVWTTCAPALCRSNELQPGELLGTMLGEACHEQGSTSGQYVQPLNEYNTVQL